MILSLHPLQASRHLRWDLVTYKALSSLLSETRKSRLGFLWWVLDPVMHMCVFYLVFGLIFERGGADFVVKLLIALVIWRWIDNCVKTCANSLISGVGLMQQVYVSKLLFPLAAIMAQSLKFMVVLAILLAFLRVYGIEPTLAWVGLLPVLLVELMFISGLGLALAAIIEFSELGAAIDHQVSTYSAGMNTRLGFATATVIEPDILLIDEILGVGDLAFRKKSSATMRNRLKSDKTAIFVSHSMPEVRALCDRVIWLDHGGVRMTGSPENVISAFEECLIKP